MKWQTKVTVEPFNQQINYKHRFYLIGSCFAEHIYHALNQRKFQATCNSFGIMYNPFSLAKTVSRIVNKVEFQKEEFFKHQDLYRHFDSHSSVSGPELQETVQLHNDLLHKDYIDIKQRDVCIITLGSAFVSELLPGKKIVANNHKLPAKNFESRMLSVNEVKSSLTKLVKDIRSINPRMLFVFTVSPVRHIKSGLLTNSRSKAVLLEGISQLVESGDNLFYFPVYEIFMDELRDYRFYAKDMVHPSDVAVEYIWERFSEWIFRQETLETIKAVEQIQLAFAHRILHKKSQESEKFIRATKAKVEFLTKKYPYLDFSDELKKWY